jgi:hypothetical protein
MKLFVTAFVLAVLASSLFPATALGQQPTTILGKTDLTGILNAAPGMPATTKDASTRDHEIIYGTFYNRASAAHKTLNDAIAMRSKDMQKAMSVTETQAKAQANSNAIVSRMGGVDKIQQMTPEQRAAAARQSMAAFQQSLVTGGGRNSPEMQAMMQKVMSDPAYRARLNNMSPKEQEEEIRRNMGAVAPQTAEAHQKAQESLRSGQEVATAGAIRSELAQMSQRITAFENDFESRDRAISSGPGSHEEIAREFAAKLAKVPMVELGEYGHDRDPEQVAALARQQAKRDLDRAAYELVERTKLYQQRKARYQQLVAEYQMWLRQNSGRINASFGDAFNHTNSELEVAGYESEMINISERLAKYSEETTADMARYEQDFKDKNSGANTSVARTTKKHS